MSKKKKKDPGELYVEKVALREWLHPADGRYPGSMVMVDGPRDRWSDVTLTLKGCDRSSVCLEFDLYTAYEDNYDPEVAERTFNETIRKIEILRDAIDTVEERVRQHREAYKP